MKFINVVTSFLRISILGHGTFLIRMAIIYLIIRFFFVDHFDLSSESATVGTYLLIFYGIYVLTAAIDHKRMESSPLFLSGFIEKKIKDDYILSNILTSKDNRGVFVPDSKVIGHEVITNFKLHHDPKLIFDRASAFLYILDSMQLPSHENTIERLNKLIEESEFMLDKS